MPEARARITLTGKKGFYYSYFSSFERREKNAGCGRAR